MVDIKGLDKAEVLAALHAGSRALGMGIFHERGGLTVEECRAILAGERGDVDYGGGMYFDYLRGRVMKVDLSGDEFSPRLYDRDNGAGAAERAISGLRSRLAAGAA